MSLVYPTKVFWDDSTLIDLRALLNLLLRSGVDRLWADKALLMGFERLEILSMVLLFGDLLILVKLKLDSRTPEDPMSLSAWDILSKSRYLFNLLKLQFSLISNMLSYNSFCLLNDRLFGISKVFGFTGTHFDIDATGTLIKGPWMLAILLRALYLFSKYLKLHVVS